MSKTSGTAWAAALGIAAAWLAPGAAAAPEDFFKGKTITYIVSTKAGGGYDTYARLIARHMEPHLPGTSIRVKNVPGAGHIVGVNQLYVARPDGLTMGTFNTGLIYGQLTGKPGIRFDLTKLSWIGKASSDPRVIVLSSKSRFRTVRDLQTTKKQALFGSSGIATASHNETMFLAHALGLNIRVIVGYGGNDGHMGMLRGEIDGAVASHSSFRTFVANGHGAYVLRVGGDGIVDPAVPSASALAKTPAAKAMVALIESTSTLGRMTAAPPGVPPDRLAVLREAYRKALTGPALLAEAAKLKLPIDPLYGDDVGRLVSGALDQPAENMKIISAALAAAAKK